MNGGTLVIDQNMPPQPGRDEEPSVLPAALPNGHGRGSLSGDSVRHALDVLSAATAATVALFDTAGQVVVGPIPGNPFIREILRSERGRQAVIDAHRAAIDDVSFTSGGQYGVDGGFAHIAVPVTAGGARIATLTLGDRPHEPIEPAQVAQIAHLLDADPDRLAAAAEELHPWTERDASDARNLAALLAELFADLRTQDEDLRRRIDELTAVYNISAMLAGSVDLQEILNRTAATVCDVMKVKACSIRMLNESTGELSIKAVYNLSQEYLSKGPVTINDNPIDSAAIRGEMVWIADAPRDPRTRYPDQARKEGIVSGLVSGMTYRGRTVGVIRVYTGERHEFSAFEAALLREVASQAAAAVVNAELMAETLEAERYARQIAYAGEVQRRMIPASPPSHPYVEFGTCYRPTYEVGGDFYDFIKLPQGNLGIAIADVSGKGVPASLQMASARAALRVNARFTYDIDRILAEVNRHLCRDTTTGEFVTAFYAVLTPDGRRLTYSNAGHDPPMLLRDGKIQYLEKGGMVLGVDPNATFERAIVHLRPGDVLLLHTDGAVEALNFSDQRFGRDRLAESLRQHGDQPAPRAAKNILWDLRRFRGLADRTDDVTLVVLKVK